MHNKSQFFSDEYMVILFPKWHGKTAGRNVWSTYGDFAMKLGQT